MDSRYRILTGCRLCGHACGADRLIGEIGKCGAGDKLIIARHLLHFGEEPPISGTKGSGTIFFSHCPLSCVFCQNHQISQDGMGREATVEELAGMMIDLAGQGAHNINLVSPTPWTPHIEHALVLASKMGLNLPVVYNTGGFDNPSMLRRLDGLVDIYLPDVKVFTTNKADRESSRKYFGAGNYSIVNQAAVAEMFRQAGHLTFDEEGVAVKGVLVRHLVLPDNVSFTDRVLKRLSEEYGRDVWVSLMAQYLPFHRVKSDPERFPELNRTLTEDEYNNALDFAMDLGMENVFIQELSAPDAYVPDFTTEKVFSNTR